MTRTRLVVTSVLGLLGLAALVAATVVVHAQPGPGGPGMRMGRRGPFDLLQLTEQQRTEIRALTESRREGREAHFKLMQQLHGDLRTELFGDAPNTAKIDELKLKIAQAQQEMFSDQIDLRLQIAQILTPEQRQKAKDAPGLGPFGRRGPRGPGGAGPGRFDGPGQFRRGPGQGPARPPVE